MVSFGLRFSLFAVLNVMTGVFWFSFALAKFCLSVETGKNRCYTLNFLAMFVGFLLHGFRALYCVTNLTWRVYLRPCPVTHHQSENSTGDTDVRTHRFFKVSRPSKVPNEIKKWPCKICCWTQILGCFYEFPDNIVRSAPVYCWMCQP